KEFIDSVAATAAESAQRDYEILLERVQEDFPDATSVSLADKDFYTELVRKERFGVDAAKVRQYFQFDRVVAGMIDLTEQLLGITFTPVQASVWHEDVQAYDVALEETGAQPVALGRA